MMNTRTSSGGVLMALLALQLFACRAESLPSAMSSPPVEADTPDPNATDSADLKPGERTGNQAESEEAMGPASTQGEAPRPSVDGFQFVAPFEHLDRGFASIRLEAVPDDSLYAIVDGSAIYRLEDETWRLVVKDAPAPIIGVDRQGNVWAASSSLAAAWDGATWTKYGPEAGWTSDPNTYFGPIGQPLFASDGSVWIPGHYNVRVFDGHDWQRLSYADMTMRDAELSDSSFSVFSLVEVDGVIWVGECTFSGPGPGGGVGARWFDGDAWHGLDSPAATGCVTEIARGSDGTIWLDVGETVYQYDPAQDEWTGYRLPESPGGTLFFGEVTDLSFDNGGDPWLELTTCGGASCYAGLARYHLDLETGSYSQLDSQTEVPTTLLFDAHDQGFLFYSGGMSQVRDEQIEQIGGLEILDPEAVLQTRDGAIWALGRVDGELGLWVHDAQTAKCVESGSQPPALSPISEGATVVEGLEPQILAYLNAGGSTGGLESSLNSLSLIDGEALWQARSQVFSVDVTGDNMAEVVMDMTFFQEGQYAEGAIFVFECREDHYQGGAIATIGGQVFTGQDPDPGIRAIEDMNENGVPEIVFSYILVIGTHANFTRAFRILEWDGTQFDDLVKATNGPPNIASVINGDGAIRDVDGDGTIELVLGHGIGRGPEANEDVSPPTDIWTWDGNAFTVLGSGSDDSDE